MGVVLEGQLGERRPLDVEDADGVECDVDTACARRDRIGVVGDGVLVERVDLGGLGGAARRRNLLGYSIERGERTPGEKDVRSLACEGPGDGAADRAAASVDHGVLVLQQHLSLLRAPRTPRCA
jgi:hypothetical protein